MLQCFQSRICHAFSGLMQMYSYFRISFAAVLSLGLCACSSATDQPVSNKITTEELVFAENPEQLRGKTDVYTAMARTVKYNVDVTSREINKKLYPDNPNVTPQEVIRGIANVKTGRENPLYDSIRILDFAVLYAVANLSDDRAYIDSNIYAKAAQNLALAAIKSHKNTLFSLKKVKEINRLIDKETKNLNELRQKQERTGRLSQADQTYKKGLEVAILKLTELRNALAFNTVEYAALIKAETKNLQLEGRAFYELEDLDKSLTVGIFQNSAFRNRNEFSLAKEMGRSYSFNEIQRRIYKIYPEIERLNINGYDVENPVYAENLQKRAYDLALTLVDDALAYRMSRKPEERKAIRLNAYDELGTAVFTQVELAYNLVKISEIDYGIVQEEVHNLKKEIKQAEKGYRLSSAKKIEILNKKIKLLELESRESQILGEKALAIRALYFYAGFSPFNTRLLRNPIKDIVVSLKAGFNKDAVEMLAAVPEQQKEEERMNNVWAKQENWLEKLIDGKKSPAAAVVLPEKSGDDLFAPYTDKAYDRKKVMQLGSYIQRENADTEWKMLQQLYPEFRNREPSVVKTRINGQIMYRLILRSENGGFMDICNRLRRDRVECLLK